MTSLEQITKAGYEVEIMWKCEFDRDILPKHPELRNTPLVEHEPLNNRDALYGGRTEAMSLHKIEEGQEKIEYCDVLSLYPYICKYEKFHVRHPVIYAGDECRDIDAMLKKEGLIECCVMPPKSYSNRSCHTDLIRNYCSVSVAHAQKDETWRPNAHIQK
jgi:hypothetical protein